MNALVALAWDSHIHHAVIRNWFSDNVDRGWYTCPITESGFVRVSSNPKVLSAAISVEAARAVLTHMVRVGRHSFLPDDVSITAADFPRIQGHRQVTDVHLLTLARRHEVRLVTFDAALHELADGRDVELLRSL